MFNTISDVTTRLTSVEVDLSEQDDRLTIIENEVDLWDDRIVSLEVANMDITERLITVEETILCTYELIKKTTLDFLFNITKCLYLNVYCPQFHGWLAIVRLVKMVDPASTSTLILLYVCAEMDILARLVNTVCITQIRQKLTYSFHQIVIWNQLREDCKL